MYRSPFRLMILPSLMAAVPLLLHLAPTSAGSVHSLPSLQVNSLAGGVSAGLLA